MKLWQKIGLGAAGVVAIGYVGTHREQLGLTGHHDDQAQSTTDAAPAGHPTSITWQKVDRSSDGFRVEMPANISQIQVPAYNESGGTDQVDMIFSNPDSETTFSVAWADNPPVVRVNDHIPDRTLQMASEGAVTRTQTMLVSQSTTKSQGYPSRDLSAGNKDGGVMSSKLIYAGQRLYMLTAVFPSAGARRDKDVARFFNSFTMTTTPGVAPAAAGGATLQPTSP